MGGMGLHKHATKRKLKFAKKLRRKRTKAETRFWTICQKLREEGVVFWNQIVLCGYVADFWCPKLQLVVEIDGPSHLEESQVKYDKHRAKVMKDELNAQTIRFTNAQVFADLEAVEKELRAKIVTRKAYLKLKAEG
jgi:very-short-patch-repair endonuclease